MSTSNTRRAELLYTLKKQTWSYFRHDDVFHPDVLLSHTKVLLQYRYVNVLIPNAWTRESVLCPLCRNANAADIGPDTEGIQWYTCQHREHLQFTRTPFREAKSAVGPTGWSFSQDSRVQYGDTIFTRHDAESGRELEDWIEWNPRRGVWKFNVSTQTWQ